MRPILDHVAIRSHDLEATLRLYVDALGLQEIQRWKHPPQVELAIMLSADNGVRLEVFDPTSTVVGAASASEASTSDSSTGVLHLALRVRGLEDAIERAVSSGATCLLPPTDLVMEPVSGAGPTRLRMAFLRGLDGEVLELIEDAA